MTEERVPDVLVERLARGELPPVRAAHVRARLEREPGGLQRLADLHVSDAEILATLRPAAVVAEVERRVGAVPSRSASFARLALAAAVVVAVGVPAVQWTQTTPPDGVTERLKGIEPVLRVYRRTPGGSEALGDGDQAVEGDVVQVEVVAAGLRHAVVASIDGRGVVTVHHPADGVGGTAVVEQDGWLLDHAYELDDAPDHETFVLVLAAAPLDVRAVVRELERGASDAALERLGADAVRRVRLEKGPP